MGSIRAACVLAALLLAAAGPSGLGLPDEAPVRPPPMEGEPMAMVGIGGSATCRGFLDAYRQERQSRAAGPSNRIVNGRDTFYTPVYGALMAWAEGYITAKNEDERLHRIVGSSSSMEQRARWLELFCQANADASFYAAVYSLREHLVADGL